MTKIDLLIEYLELKWKANYIDLAKAKFCGSEKEQQDLRNRIVVLEDTLELLRMAKNTNNKVLKELNEYLEEILYN